MASRLRSRIFLLLFAVGFSSAANAQYSLTATPYQATNYSYYSGVNLGWSLGGPGFAFNWNGGNVNPPFGPFDPNANAQIGGAFRNGPYSGGFRLTAGQGADSSFVSQTPSVVVPNGGVGFISDTTQRPFVTGIIPVVGNAEYQTVLQERLARLRAAAESANRESPDSLTLGKNNAAGGREPVAILGGGGSQNGPSTAERGDVSVAEIRSRQASQTDTEQQEIAALIAKAKSLDQAGEVRIARIYYQQAARKATGEQQQQLLARVKEIDTGGKR